MKLQRVSNGQAIVFVVLIILILIAFAGLTIDAGQAMERQRRIQHAANSSAVAAMNGVILQNYDGKIMETINKTMVDNNVKNFQRVNVGEGWGDDPDKVYFTAEYLDASGAFLGDVGAQPSTKPADRGAAHVVVKTSVDVQNTFAKVVGVDTFGVSADGAAGSGPCVIGVYPVTFHKIYLEKNLPAWYKPITMEAAGLSPLADAADIPSLNTTNPNSPRFRVSRRPNDVGIPGNFSWTRWNGNEQQSSSQQLGGAMTGSGSLANGFAERTPPADDSAALRLMNGRLEVGDWLAADGGNNVSQDVTAALNAHIANKTFMILPIHDRYTGQGNDPQSGYHVERFVKVRLLDYALTPIPESFFEFALIQDKVFCAQQVPPPPPPTNGYPFRIDVTEQLQWYNPAEPGTNYDIAIIQDYSTSMRFCWDTNSFCATGSRRIDKAAPVLRSFVDEFLVQRNEAGGENRLAYVTYNAGATQRVPFMNDTTAALAAFKQHIGDLTSPRTIPDTELNGNTNTASGLVGAVSYLNSARTVDSHGKPVRLAVLLITDGLTNVFNDGGYQNVSNRFNQQPFRCGDSAADMDNPYVQSTCPSNEEFPNINPKPLPPIKAMVKAANDARAAKPITFYAVVVGAQFGLTPVSMHLNEVAPDNYYMADNPAQLEALVTSIEQELGEPCAEKTGTPIPAGGAKVTIAYQSGGVVGTFTTNADGSLIVPNLLAGTYTITIQHLGVIADQDPLQQPRNYTKMIIEGGSAVPVSSMTVIMPKSAYTAPKVKLVIDDPTNAQCPN